MSRPHFHPAKCRVCDKRASDTVSISQTGLCLECSKERLAANVYAMKTKRGPFAQWWAFRMAQSVGWAPLDGAPPRP